MAKSPSALSIHSRVIGFIENFPFIQNRAHEGVTQEERHTLKVLLKQGHSQVEIANRLGRHRLTISRELRRNGQTGTGRYYGNIAHEQAVARRRRARRGPQFSAEDWAKVCSLIQKDWSPEQVSLVLRANMRASKKRAHVRTKSHPSPMMEGMHMSANTIACGVVI
jgi:IS30 family transposase